MPSNDVTKAERDLAIRTMLGEANGQGDAGLAAVGHVIMNRVASGKYGGTNAADVVLAPSQFEPWQTRKSELLSYSPSDPKYRRAADIFDQIVSGEMPDITDGATHFLNAKVVRDRGNYGGGLPKWTAGGGQDIGDHTFYKPDGAVRRARPAASDVAPGASWDDVLGDAAVNAPKGAAAAKATTTPGSPKATPPGITPQLPGATPDMLWDEITAGAKGNVREAKPDPTAQTAVVAPPAAPDPAAGDASAAVGRGIINGIPVVGPAILGGLNKGIAGIRSLQSGKSYADELAAVQQFGQATADAHPYATTAGELGGGIAALGPVGATATGARALGLAGENLLARGLAGGLSGGLIGAADAGVRGGDVGTSGVVGGVLGGAAPGVGKIVGAGTNALINAVGERVVPVAPGLSGSAGKVLNGLISADGPQAVQNRLMALGSNGMLAEAGPALEGAAAGLIPKPGEAKSILVNAVRERAAGANGRLNDDVRAAIGPAEDPTRVTAEILALRKAKGAVDYPAALEAAPPVDVSKLVSTIDGALKTAEGAQKTALQTLRSRLVKSEATGDPTDVRSMLIKADGTPLLGGKRAGPQLQTNAENLHNIKGELDAVINHAAPGLGVEGASVARTQGALKRARGELNAALEAQVPGYAEANRTSAALAKRAEAVETGTQVLGSGKTTPTPEALAETLNTMSPGERIALAKGTRGEIERQLGVKVNDLTALKSALQGEGGWNTAKLASIFGEEGTNRLVGAVSREAAFADTTNKLLQNSQTANRMGGAKFIEDAVGNKVDLKGATVTGLAATAGKKAIVDPILNLLTRTDNSRRDAEIARVLSSVGPDRDRLVAALTNRSGALEKTNKLAAFLAARTNTGANLLTNAAAQPYARSR